MEATNGVCPTDILIDITDDVLPSFANDKESSVLDIFKSKASLKEKENTLIQIKDEDHLSILDVSPFRIIDENELRQNKELDIVVEPSAKSKEVVNDCPTGILVDVPRSLSSALKPNIEFNSSDYRSRECDKTYDSAQELKDKFYADSSKDDFRKDFIDASPSIDETNDQLLHSRRRWKTPSPQSMSRISKEASKVINNLNSSEIFDEDLLLIEEKLPIPINFDDFEDNTDQNQIENFERDTENEITKLSISIDSQISKLNSEKNEDEAVNADYANVLMLKENIKNAQSHSEIINSKDYSEPDTNSYSLSSVINSDSLDSSKLSTANDSIDDVFMEKSISSEDKENMQRREANNKVGTPSKALLKSESKLQFRATLRNVSNIVSDSTDSEKSPINKSIIPQKRMSLAPKLKLTPSSVGKLQIKKTVKEVESRKLSKISTGSNVFLLPNTKQISMQKPGFTKNTTTTFPDAKQKSSSLDVKQTNGFSTMRTPSKRYSISTPLKSASVSKPPLTAALHKNPPARYTPQCVPASRLSFSKSLQQPLSVSRTSIYKEKKELSSFTPLASSLSFRAYSGIQNTFNNQKRQSFSQSMSAASFRSLGKTSMSTNSKGRFGSKLNLPTPLHTEQEKKLARNLFPSLAGK